MTPRCRAMTLAVVFGALGLPACTPAIDYTESEWPKNLRLDPAPAQLAIGFAPGSSRIPPDDLARLRMAVTSGDIVPSDRVLVAAAEPPSLATARFDAVTAALLPYGIVPVPASGAGATPNTAIIRRERYLVTLPACPNWSKLAAGAGDFTNTHSSNFGCAAAVNLGLMVAQPADLVEPRQIGLTDAHPAVAAVNAYRAGKVQLPAAAKIGPIAPVANQPPPPVTGEGGAAAGGSGAQQ